MKIAAPSNYNAVQAFGPIELPKLTILTGPNGSGKSQLLAGLHTQEIFCDLITAIPTSHERSGRAPAGHPSSNHPAHGVTLLRNAIDNDAQFDAEMSSRMGHRFGGAPDPNSAQSLTYQFDELRGTVLSSVRVRLMQSLPIPMEQLIDPGEDVWHLGAEELIARAGISLNTPNAEEIKSIFKQASKDLSTRDHEKGIKRNTFIADVEKASKEFNVHILEVTRDLVGIIRDRISADMFQPNIVQLFSSYRDRRYSNDMDKVLASRKPGKKYLTDEEFTTKYGAPPWEAVTELLTAMGLPFEVLPPPEEMELPVGFRLKSATANEALKFSDLSSGEQVLVRFAVAIMSPHPSMAGLERPKLLLLDEMDASLHPKMVQRWLSAIEYGVVGEFGVHVILTTHSPTTVALSPEGSIYTMIDGKPYSISKQDAINKLTFGVPTLSIDFSGRRQVFCESDTDAAVFEKIYSAIKPNLSLSKELDFIAPSIRDKSNAVKDDELGVEMHSGEAVVRKIVNSLAKNDVQSAYGLIDWDQKAKSSERIHVLAEGSHYTLENIILDPFLIGALMVLDGLKVPGLSINRSQFHALDTDGRQSLADLVQNQIDLPGDDGSLTEIEYMGGATVKIKKRYTTFNGHDLQDLIFDKFKQFGRYPRGRGALPLLISRTVISDYTAYCPKPVSDAFYRLSNADLVTPPLAGRP